MTVVIEPSRAAGSVAAPPSKSMAHRLLICARQGRHTVRGVEASEDILATMDCLRALGTDCEFRDGEAALQSAPGGRIPGGAVLPCRESGSTLRFFLPLCLSGAPVTLTGSPRLLSRPLGVYEKLCAEQGIAFERGAASLRVQGCLKPGEFVLPGDVSSQFVSGLLFALPGLPGDSVIRLLPPVESRSYIDMTLAALTLFGIETRREDPETIRVPGGQTGEAGPSTVTVEGDWSNAAFFFALGDAVSVTGLDRDSLQGDRVCREYFRALDAGGAELDISDCPDLGPVLFAYAAMNRGGSFTGTRRLSLKESDRGRAMQEELAKFGVPVELGENRIIVGSGLRRPREPLAGHNDHRIVMALSVLCTVTGGTILGAEAVRKSFPDFFRKLGKLGIKVKENDGMDIE